MFEKANRFVAAISFLLLCGLLHGEEAKEKTFDWQVHFPKKPVFFATVQSGKSLAQGLRETLLGRIATHPGTLKAFERLFEQLRPKLEEGWAPFVQVTGKSPLEILSLLEGEVAFEFDGLSPPGVPEISVAIELGRHREEILAVEGRLRKLFEDETGQELRTAKFGAIEATVWPTPGVEVYEAILGTHLVLVVGAEPFKLVAEAFQKKDGRPGAKSLPDPGGAEGAAKGEAFVYDLFVHLDVPALIKLAAWEAPGRVDPEAEKFLEVAGIDGVEHLQLFSRRARGGGVETVADLKLRNEAGGVLGILRDGFAAVGDPKEALALIPAAAHEVSAFRVNPGKMLREIDALVRKSFPEAAQGLDEIYRQMEDMGKISFTKDLLALGDVTVYSFCVEPQAGGLFSDQVLLVRTDALAPYWKLLERVAGLVGASFRTLEHEELPGAKVQYLTLADSPMLKEMPLSRLFGGGMWTPSPAELAVLAVAGAGVALSRADLPGGWSAVATLPQALVRHLGARSSPRLAVDKPFGGLVAETLGGSVAGTVSRGGNGILWAYNSLVSVAGAFSPFLSIVGVDAASLPPAEFFLEHVRPGQLRVIIGPERILFRGERVLETYGGSLAALGGAAVIAGVVTPTLLRGRGDAYKIQCANNLRQLYMYAMAYSDKSGTRAFPYSPEGSLAALNLMIESDPEGLGPRLFVCPEGEELPAEVDADGKFTLKDENTSYEIVPWRVRNTATGKLLMYDKQPFHRGGRNVVFTDSSVRFMAEYEFQQMLAQEKDEAASAEAQKKAAPRKKASAGAAKEAQDKAAGEEGGAVQKKAARKKRVD